MTSGAPEKIRLIPDEWHIKRVGRLRDGRQFLVDTQLAPRRQKSRDYACSFLFDADGQLLSNDIEFIGERGDYPSERVAEILDTHLAALGDHEITEIWIRLFEIRHDDEIFGFVPVSPEEFLDEDDDPEDVDDEDWRVEFMPGNTLSFYPPWEDGGYDT